MNITRITICLTLAFLLLTGDDALAGLRGGGGGGRGGGGGGGARGGGAAMSRGSAPSLGANRGSVSRPSPAMNRPAPGGMSRPSVSRPAPAVQRPSGGLNPGASRPAVNLPSGGGASSRPSLPNMGAGNQRPATSIPGLGSGYPQRPTTLPGQATRPRLPDRPTTFPSTRPGTRPSLPDRPTTQPGTRPALPGRPGGERPTTRPGQPPSEGSLDDFLGIQRPRPLPGNGGAITRPTPGERPLPDTRPIPGTRPGPGTDRPVTLPGELPNRPGQNERPDWMTRPNRPDNNDPIHKLPPWVENRPGNDVGDRWANAVTRPGYNNWIERHPSRRARWDYWGSNVRHQWNYHHHHCDWFGPNWWHNHYHNMGGWHYCYAYNKYQPSYWWTVPTYVGLSNWFTWSAPASAWAQPVYYDYGQGGNVYYENNSVYVNGAAVGSAEDFAASAAQLATVAPPASEAEAETSEWMPLGTFAVSSDQSEQLPTRTVQLAVNQQGIVSGTLYNEATDTAQALLGQVDKETQRVALRVGESEQVIMETGLYNLTQEECPVMVHFGPDKVEYWLLVRLEYQE